jgi:DNA-binding NarL/FixJ family response regulator
MARILIADDNETLRNALRHLLSKESGWSVCGEATNGRSVVSMALELKPDLIILDFLMPLTNGIAAAAEISKSLPNVPVVLYTMHVSDQLEREAKRFGIRNVLSKTEPFENVMRALKDLLPAEPAGIGPLQLSGDILDSNSSGEIAGAAEAGPLADISKDDPRPNGAVVPNGESS